MDALSAVFFIIAGIWLLAAIVYSLMVLYFLRLRSLQLLHIIHDDSFGRLYFFPKFGCFHSDHSQPPEDDRHTTTPSRTAREREYYYISLGWIFRRYARHLNLDVMYDRDAQQRPRYKRSERRTAVRILLLQQHQQQQAKSTLRPSTRTNDCGAVRTNSVQSYWYSKTAWMRNHIFSTVTVPNAVDDTPLSTPPLDQQLSQFEGDVATHTATSNPPTISDKDNDDEVPICSICLGSYDDNDDVVVDTSPTQTPTSTIHATLPSSNNNNSNDVFQSTTCIHVFHMECLLNWLQRPKNTACPCCRIPMLDETKIWNTILEERKQKQRRRRRASDEEMSPKEPKPESEYPMEDTTNSETEHDGV